MMQPPAPIAVEAPLPGLSFLGTVVESMRQALLLLVRNRLLWCVVGIEAALGAIGFGLAGVAAERLDGRELFSLFAWWFLASVLMPWTTMYLAVQAVHGDIEDRTCQYVLLRPVRRAALLLGRWLAVILLALLVAEFGCASLFLGVAGRPALWSDGVDVQLGWAFGVVLAIGTVAHAALGTWFAASCRRPLVWSAAALTLQTLIALLPMSAGIRMATISDPLRRLVLDRIEPGARLARLLWPGERDFRSELIGQPLLSLGVLTGVVMVLALRSYSRTEYDSRPRD